MNTRFLWITRFYIFLFLNTILLYIPNLILKKNNSYVFVLKKLGVGDDVLMTSMLDYYSKKGNVYLFYQSYPEVFDNLNIKKYFLNNNFMGNQLLSFLRTSIHSNIIGSSNGNWKNQNYLVYKELREGRLFLRDVLFLSRKDFLKKLKQIPREAKIIFSDKELKKMDKKWGYLRNKRMGIFISEPSRKPGTSAKNWGVEKVQKVINKTKNRIDWVQVGSIQDKGLRNCIDLRGKTTLRELFFICSIAKLVFTIEGLLTHLSSAFNVPCYTIYSGFHYPEISKYKNTIPLEPHPLPSCCYCWESPCKQCKKYKCLKNIKVVDVVIKINKALNEKKIK